jgi:hypothetical protein
MILMTGKAGKEIGCKELLQLNRLDNFARKISAVFAAANHRQQEPLSSDVSEATKTFVRDFCK